MEEEFAKFVADYKPEEAAAIPAIKTHFKAYVTNDRVRQIIESRQFTELATNPYFSTPDFRAVPKKHRTLVPEYVKDYVSLNQFTACSMNLSMRRSNCGESAIFKPVEFHGFSAGHTIGQPHE